MVYRTDGNVQVDKLYFPNIIIQPLFTSVDRRNAQSFNYPEEYYGNCGQRMAAFTCSVKERITKCLRCANANVTWK